jgi:hypothetical protein
VGRVRPGTRKVSVRLTVTYAGFSGESNAYAEAGADLLFLSYLRPLDTKMAVHALPKPLFNVVIDTPKEEMERAGLKVSVYPVQSSFIAHKALRDMLKELRTTGAIANLAQRTPSMEEFGRSLQLGIKPIAFLDLLMNYLLNVVPGSENAAMCHIHLEIEALKQYTIPGKY